MVVGATIGAVHLSFYAKNLYNKLILAYIESDCQIF